MTCDQRRDQMFLLLLDSLEPAEAADLRAHIAGGCPRCAGALAEAEATLGHLPFALAPATVPAEARRRLMERIGAEGAPDAPRQRERILRLPRWAQIALPAAVAACVSFIITGWFMLHINRKQRREYTDVVSLRDQTIASLVRQVHNTNSTLEPLLQSRRQAILTSRTQESAFARVWWDENRRSWHFRAFGLEKPQSAKIAYELWFITPYGRKVPAITFTPDDQGGAYLVVTAPADVGPLAAFAVTDEPSVGTFQPTGAVHLYGRLE